MEPKISVKFAEYQNKYPLYTQEAIADIMLRDGVISKDVAEKIKAGESLFVLDYDNALAQKIDFNITEIFGGNFKAKKFSSLESTTSLKTNKKNCIPKLGNFIQGFTGDCVLLSELKSLSRNDIGAQYIDNAIKVDRNGDYIVTLFGVGKSYKIPKRELYNPLGVLGNLKASAIEKAVYMYIKQRKQELKEGVGPDIIDKYESPSLEGRWYDPYREIYGFQHGMLTYLLTGCYQESKIDHDTFRRNPECYIGIVSFRYKDKKWYSDFIDLMKDFIGKPMANHEYSLKDIKENGDIIVNNPHFSMFDVEFDTKELDDLKMFLNIYNTQDFMQKPIIKKTQEGKTIIYKRLDGTLCREILKDINGQVLTISEYDTKGNLTACQEYNNGQKSKLTYYYNNDDEPITEHHYFQNNKYIKQCCEFANEYNIKIFDEGIVIEDDITIPKNLEYIEKFKVIDEENYIREMYYPNGIKITYLLNEEGNDKEIKRENCDFQNLLNKYLSKELVFSSTITKSN